MPLWRREGYQLSATQVNNPSCGSTRTRSPRALMSRQLDSPAEQEQFLVHGGLAAVYLFSQM